MRCLVVQARDQRRPVRGGAVRVPHVRAILAPGTGRGGGGPPPPVPHRPAQGRRPGPSRGLLRHLRGGRRGFGQNLVLRGVRRPSQHARARLCTGEHICMLVSPNPPGGGGGGGRGLVSLCLGLFAPSFAAAPGLTTLLLPRPHSPPSPSPIPLGPPGTVLIERGDRVAIQGDQHPTVAAALTAFGGSDASGSSVYGLVRESLLGLDSGCRGCHVVDDGILAYPLYWTLSVMDYYWSAGDLATLGTSYLTWRPFWSGPRKSSSPSGLTLFGWDGTIGLTMAGAAPATMRPSSRMPPWWLGRSGTSPCPSLRPGTGTGPVWPQRTKPERSGSSAP